ncbi:hypothetical protein EGT45_18600 [Yersinia pestis]|uniref:Uncharacterized protein n=1 Tax=Yersinia pseudotuberculosis TaxID=633 RepID=A0ABM7AHT6_YERPU|nr:hypothetical protein EGX42_13100 [Yersinia pestis]AYW86840.1 hypothetical protein EGX87_06315 [Yersinia pseudotuberculosis]AYW91955.1 hypothetical protein EGX47_12015 [Yersinia pseudotuberculosis]AYW96230.1 hypothetical protein EGX39_10680 [Yersinia pseudotuberculosis]AYX01479.1 hypothetical protein EGX53_17515 [Yersinia pseudotuberculosis]
MTGRRQARDKWVWNPFEPHLCYPQGVDSKMRFINPQALIYFKVNNFILRSTTLSDWGQPMRMPLEV